MEYDGTSFYGLVEDVSNAQNILKSVAAPNFTVATGASFTNFSSTFGGGKIKSINLKSGEMLACGDDGEIKNIDLTSLALTDLSVHHYKNPFFNDIQSGHLSGSIYAVGNGGKLLQKNTNGEWQYLTTSVSENLNAIKINNYNTAVIAGDNGGLWKKDMLQTTASCQLISSGTTKNLNDVFINVYSSYIVGNNGTLIYIANINTLSPPPAIANISTTSDFIGVAAKPVNAGVLVGNHSVIFNYAQTNARKISNVFVPKLNDVSFVDAVNPNSNLTGYVVGDYGTARFTMNGGQFWNGTKINKYYAGSNAGYAAPDINSVCRIDNSSALAVGNLNYLALLVAIRN